MKNRGVLYSAFIVAAFFILAACNNANTTVTAEQSAQIQTEVKQMTDNIVTGLATKGPIIWLDYFEKTPAFYMAVGPSIAFADNDSATAFVQNVLVKNIRMIRLTWSNMRIDPLAPTLANIAANFDEVMTQTSGAPIHQPGYFTATAEKTAAGWQLRNLHWSN